MPTFTVETGYPEAATGRWVRGSYRDTFEARDIQAAKDEVDRRLFDEEIKCTEGGSAVRVFGNGADTWRSLDGGGRHSSWS
jgi:hypothetical protein